MLSALIVTSLLALNPDNPEIVKIRKCAYVLQPDINPDVADQLSRSLYYWSREFHVDPYVSLALAYQESSLDPAARSETHDFGLFQLNLRTIKAYQIDRVRLMLDVDYAVESYMRVMDDKLNVCKSRTAVGCFHSFTPELRDAYQLLVMKHLKKINSLRLSH